MVHTAFSKVRPVESGPAGLIEALRLALGPGGTLVMPSMASDDDHVFDPRTTPCLDMGVVAETFWQQPGVLRSDSPHAFAAAGPLAARITTPIQWTLPTALLVQWAESTHSTVRCFSWAWVTIAIQPFTWRRIWPKSGTGALATPRFYGMGDQSVSITRRSTVAAKDSHWRTNGSTTPVRNGAA